MSSAVPLIWRARTDSGSRAIARKTAQAHERRQDRGPEHAQLRLVEPLSLEGMVAISSETVNPMPATAPPPTIRAS